MGLKSVRFATDQWPTTFAPYMGLKRLVELSGHEKKLFAPYMGLKSMLIPMMIQI